MSPRILIAGIGNIFLGDDAFGVEVSRELIPRALPAGVRVVDYGIRGFDLAYALLDDWDAVILVDALGRGGEPGTLYLLEPDLDSMRNSQAGSMAMNPHGMDPVQVLQLAFSLGELRAKIYLVGCEPKDFGDELEGRMGLSGVVQASIGGAIAMINNLVERILAPAAACMP